MQEKDNDILPKVQGLVNKMVLNQLIFACEKNYVKIATVSLLQIYISQQSHYAFLSFKYMNYAHIGYLYGNKKYLWYIL